MKTMEELARAVEENISGQKEIADKLIAEIKARSAALGEYPAFAEKLKALEAKLGEGVVTDKQLGDLNKSIADLQAAYKAFKPVLDNLHGGSDGGLLRMDTGYHNPLEGRVCPNQRSAEAMAMFLRACTVGGGQRTDLAKRLEDRHGLKLQAPGEIAERAASIHAEETGGVALPTELGAPIIAAMGQYGVATSESPPETMGSTKRAYVKDSSDIDVHALDEGAEIDEVDPSFSMVQLEAKLWGAFTRWSLDYEQAGLAAIGEGWTQRFARAFAKRIDQCAFTADGTSTYNNFVGLLNHASISSVSQAATKTSVNDVTYDNLLALIAAVSDEVYEEGNCKFFCSGSLTHVLKGVKDGIGRPLLTDAVSGGLSLIIGEPVRRTGVMPRLSSDAAGLKFMGFGDLRRALRIGVRNMMTVAFSEHAYFTRGQMAMRVLGRIGTVVADTTAFKVLKTADA